MRWRPTVTITVFGCFADVTTPTFVLRRKRRQPVAASPAGSAVCATVAAVRLRTLIALLAVDSVADGVRGAIASFGAAEPSPVREVARAAAGFAAALRAVVVVFFAAVFSAATAFFSGASAFVSAFFAAGFFVVFSATTKPPSQRARPAPSADAPYAGARWAARDSSSAGAWPA